jgi:hypothetical protein
MKEKEESASKETLTKEQIEEINSYPNYWRNTLREAAERGESIKEVYEELKDLDYLT